MENKIENKNDTVGKTIVKRIFNRKRQILNDSEGQYCSYDLSGNIGSDFVVIEVKNRNRNSTDYMDNFCELSKLKKNRKFTNYAMLASIYNDDVIRFSYLSSDEFTVQKKWCPETTDFGRTRYVLKDCAVFSVFKDNHLSSYGLSKEQIIKEIYG